MNKDFPYAITVIKPDSHRDVLVEMIMEDFRQGGFSVVKRKDMKLSEEQAREIYKLEGLNLKLELLATKSLVGEGENRNITLVILKSLQDVGSARDLATELKGKTNVGGIRAKYKNLNLGENAKNRLHISDTDESSLKILNMLLTTEEKKEIMMREPELYNELHKILLAEEMKKQLVRR